MHIVHQRFSVLWKVQASKRFRNSNAAKVKSPFGLIRSARALSHPRQTYYTYDGENRICIIFAEIHIPPYKLMRIDSAFAAHMALQRSAFQPAQMHDVTILISRT